MGFFGVTGDQIVFLSHSISVRLLLIMLTLSGILEKEGFLAIAVQLPLSLTLLGRRHFGGWCLGLSGRFHNGPRD